MKANKRPLSCRDASIVIKRKRKVVHLCLTKKENRRLSKLARCISWRGNGERKKVTPIE